MKMQSEADRMDESLGERNKPEDMMKQSYGSRRHEMEGMEHPAYRGARHGYPMHGGHK